MIGRVAILGAFLATLAGPALATREYILPTRFDVVDVAADDVLNVRARPDARAEIIGTLAPDEENVEVVAHDASGRWGLVNVGERSGWVAMRYLDYRVDVWEPGALPDGLQCLGTEPFWSMRPEADRLVLATPETEETGTIIAILDTGIFRDPRRVVLAEGEDWQLTASLTAARCSDGMSDRAYGLEAMLVREDEAGASLLAGCCTIGR